MIISIREGTRNHDTSFRESSLHPLMVALVYRGPEFPAMSGRGDFMKSIPGLPGYFATRDGRIFSNKFGRHKELRLYHDKDGYRKVTLMRPNGTWSPYPVHRLILLSYKGKPPKGFVCDHKDDNKDNNAIDNLRWVSLKFNLTKRVRNYEGEWGTWGAWSKIKVRGESCGSAKLSASTVRKMRKLHATGNYSYKKLGEMFGVTGTTARCAVKKITWSHIT